MKPIPRADYMNGIALHELVLSASRCICELYSDIVIWSESKKKKSDYRKTLSLDRNTYDEMEHWINNEFENRFDFPDIFNSYETL